MEPESTVSVSPPGVPIDLQPLRLPLARGAFSPASDRSQLGIVDFHQPPRMGFTVSNQWLGYINDQSVTVSAGADRDPNNGTPVPTGPGRVVLEAIQCQTCTTAYGEFIDPRTVGPLRITAVHFPELTLVDGTGRRSSFNLLTATFSR